MVRPSSNSSIVLQPALYLLAAWTTNYLFGFISFEHDSASVLARDAGAAFVLPLLTAVLWIGKRVCIRSAVDALSHVASHRRHRNALMLSKTFETIFYTNLKKWRIAVTIIALIFASSYLYTEDLFYVSTQQQGVSEYRYILLLQTVPLWFCVLNFLLSIFLISRVARTYIIKYLRVRLFEIEELSPFCNLVIVNFLVSILAISIYPINSLFINLPETDKYVILVFCLILFVTLMYPIYLVQKALRSRKHLTLTRINDSLSTQLSYKTDMSTQRRLVDDDDHLQFIADLLVVRKEISQAPLWPMNMPFTVKMAFILTLPLLSWVGAGVVSQLLKTVVPL